LEIVGDPAVLPVRADRSVAERRQPGAAGIAGLGDVMLGDGFRPCAGRSGQWERVCRCHREAVTVLDDTALDPNSAAAEPAWTAHQHALTCEASDIASVVRVEKREAGTGWRTTCLACGSMCFYYWDPDRLDSSGRPIRREGDVRYQYELKHQTVAL
jgi:hypothetical protein